MLLLPYFLPAPFNSVSSHTPDLHSFLNPSASQYESDSSSDEVDVVLNLSDVPDNKDDGSYDNSASGGGENNSGGDDSESGNGRKEKNSKVAALIANGK